jgi:urate oxidase
MAIKMGKNAYGKNAVNISKIIRHASHHEFRHLSVNVVLEGDFDSAHTQGDNTKLLPTDTQKNTVYVLAKEHLTGSAEAFGLYLANYFLSNNPSIAQVRIEITEHSWNQMLFNGQPHPHAYTGSNSEKHTVVIEQHATGSTVTSGIADMLILKTTDSGFENYIKDKYTTLKETDDRIFCTQCEASWIYTSPQPDFSKLYTDIRNTLLQTFANHNSLSVQQTLYAMGEEVLKQFDVVKEISMKMPNKHHILFNLQQFGMENKNEIFIATDEPYGYITGTVVRE